MKHTVKIIFALNQIVSHFRKFIISVLLISVSLMLISLTLMGYQGILSVENSCNKTLAQGMEKSGIIMMPAEFNVNFINEIYQKDEIESIGTCGYGGNDSEAFDSLKSIQSGFAKDYRNTVSNYLEILFINRNLLQLCELKLETGDILRQTEDNDEYTDLYLGNAYSGKIETGTFFTDSKTKYKVAGIFEKGTTWINPDIVNGIDSSDVNYSINLDYSVILVDDMLNTNAFLFSISDRSNMQEVMTLISDTSDKYQIEISLGSIEQIYGIAKNDSNLLISYLIRILIIVIFSSMLMITCLQIVTILTNKNTFGILYAIGSTESDIISIIIYENIIKLFLSFILCCLATIFYAYKWFGKGMITFELIEFMLRSIIPYILLSAVTIIAIASAIPIFIFHKLSPVDLIGGKND